MRRVYLSIALACVPLAIILSQLPAAEEAPEKVREAAQLWDYRVLLLTDVAKVDQTPREQILALERTFDELGDEGWELCEATTRIVVLKRPQR